MSIIDEALKLAAERLPVFPCNEDKTPLISGGFKSATTDPDTIRRMFNSKHATLIGVPTGIASGIIAVDLDIKNGNDASLWYEENKESFGETRFHDTRSGGLHILYRMPNADIRNSASKIAAGVDIRGNGGYIIVPPSPGYQVAHDVEPAEMPQWLVDACLAPKPMTLPTTRQSAHNSYAEAALDGEVQNVRTAPEGARNATLNTAALKLGQLVAAGALSRATAEAALTSAAMESGLRPGEISKTLRSGLEAGLAQPRDIPERNTPDGQVEEIHPAQGLLIKANGLMLDRQQKETADLDPVILGDLDGALKMLVDYSVSTAFSPQPFLALGGALALVGALAGRRYASRTDLRTNVFIIALAGSSSGKDQPRKCNKAALGYAGLTQYLGGEKLASDQSIYSSIELHPARLFQFDEFGHMIAGLVSRNAPGHKQGIVAAMTSIYTSPNTVVPGTEYAHQKGQDGKKRVDLHQPHMCVYGSTVAGRLWEAMRSSNSDDGTLARYLVFQALDDNPDYNHDPAPISSIAPELVERLQQIAAGVPDHDYGGNVAATMQATTPMLPYVVPETPEATTLIRSISDGQLAWKRDLKTNGQPGEAFVGRMHAHITTAAMIRAIGRDPSAPQITVRDVQWAKRLVDHCLGTAMRETASQIADSAVEAEKKRILAVVKKTGRLGISKNALTRQTQFLNGRTRDQHIADLIEGGQIIRLKGDSATKSAAVFVASAF